MMRHAAALPLSYISCRHNTGYLPTLPSPPVFLRLYFMPDAFYAVCRCRFFRCPADAARFAAVYADLSPDAAFFCCCAMFRAAICFADDVDAYASLPDAAPLSPAIRASRFSMPLLMLMNMLPLIADYCRAHARRCLFSARLTINMIPIVDILSSFILLIRLIHADTRFTA